MPLITRNLASPEIDRQYLQTSRRGKKTWRKYIDIRDVENGLEQNKIETINGGLIYKKTHDELFTLDTNGAKPYPKESFLPTTQPLKRDIIIAQRSAISSISTKRRKTILINDLTTPGTDLKTSRHTNNGFNSLNILPPTPELDHTSANATPNDIWDISGPSITTRRPSKLPNVDSKRPSEIDDELLSGGYSYNPPDNDYKNRLALEGDWVLKAEKNRHMAAEKDHKFRQAVELSAAEAELAESRINIVEWEGGSTSDENEKKIIARRPKRKTRSDRNRIYRRKVAEQKSILQNIELMKAVQLARVHDIANEVLANESNKKPWSISDTDQSTTLKLQNRTPIKRLPLKFSGIPVPEQDLEIILPEELQDSLRLLKPQGNILRDAYKKQLMGGIIENRRKRPFKKKASVKAVSKWTFKDFLL